jgi:hypothetical protein
MDRRWCNWVTFLVVKIFAVYLKGSGKALEPMSVVNHQITNAV